VLDFGGGNGYFSKGFYLNGVSVDLYDIDKKSMAVAKKKGINIINHIDPIPRYDLVFSSHVIEHCVDLNQFIAQAIAPLKMGGILAICCPNKNANEFYRYFHCRRYRDQIESASVSETTKQWFCFDPPRHLYAISQNTLKVLAKSHGLELLELFTEYLRTANFHSGDLPLPFLIKPLMKNWRLMSDTILSVCFSRVMTLSHGRCGDSLVAIMRKSG
jgi:2-polyprenyl-3-methyl-5-hydroxy-6-metoxy-1,4-benzoquinol methylase